MSFGNAMHVLVMAKAPVPGRVKTRLCPPCTHAEAAIIAAAALADTLDAVVACGAARRILALDGAPGEWLPPGFEVIPQRGATFDARLANAWTDAGGPGIQVGMDTPQVTGGDLDDALATLEMPRTDAVLGPAVDGGWWAVGMRRPSRDAFLGVPMSTDTTGARQLERLRTFGWSVRLLPAMVDLDDMDAAIDVAAAAPHSRTARALTPFVAAVAGC